MSQPGQNPSPPSNTPPHSPATRTMADLARLFLDGARQTPENGAPKRISPQARTRAAAPVVPTPPAPAPAVQRSGKEVSGACSRGASTCDAGALSGKESSPAAA